MKTSELGVYSKDISTTQWRKKMIRSIRGKNLACVIAQAIYFLSFEIIMAKVEVANHTPYRSAINDTIVILEHPDL